nr:PilZ domain-containing protein [uncultured Sphingomonas sp.]
MTNQFRAAILAGKTPGKPDQMLQDKSARASVADDLTSIPVTRDEARVHDHRWNDRHRLQEEKATVRYNDAEYAVDLINLSGGGAMIRGDFEPRMWDKLHLVLGDSDGASIECAVRWLRRDRIGLEFAHETQLHCDSRTRDKLLFEVVRRSFPDLVDQDAPADFGTVDAPAVEEETEAQRSQRRHPLIWMADVPYDHSIERVRIRNISETGAMVESSTYFPIGTEVMLDMGDAGQHFARVVWARGDQFGFAFVSPFDLTNLARARATVTPQRWTQPSYLRRDSTKASPWSEHWNRRSLEDLREDLGAFLGR